MAGIILSILIGLSSGFAVAAGIFAFVMSLGFVERMAAVTRTEQYVKLYESIVFFGAGFGNIMTIYPIKIFIGKPGAAVFGVLSGVFTGILSIALVEVLKSIPIMLRRAGIRRGLGFIVLFYALGKLVGGLFQFINGWTPGM